MDGGSLAKELRQAGINATPSAFVQRRKAIDPQGMREIFRDFNNFSPDPVYGDYRIYAIDGTTVNMARNPNSPSFMSNPHNLRGYNQLHVNLLYDVSAMTYLDCVIQPKPQADELAALYNMLDPPGRFCKNSLLLADRGYESYNTIAHLMNTENLDFLLRIKQDRSAMREVAKLPMTTLDTDVSFTITTRQTNADKQAGHIFLQVAKNKNRTYSPKTLLSRWDFPSPYPMKFRVVRFQLSTGEYETVATSLPRSSFGITEIKELYHLRWGIETSFRNLKYTLGLVNLHGKSEQFVEQEIYAALIMYNFCSRIMQGVEIPDRDGSLYPYKVNFKMAVSLCKEFFRDEETRTDMDEKHAAKLIEEIKRYTEPVREGRQDFRNMKPKSFAGFIYRVAA